MTDIEFIDKEITSYKHLAAFSSNDAKKYYEECVVLLQQIKAELEEYKNITTPKKVHAEWHAGYDPQLYYPKSFYCPSCSRRLRGNQSYKHCPKCGQALDWIYI